MAKKILITVIALSLSKILLGLLLIYVDSLSCGTSYTTTSLEDYGTITGNGNNSRAKELFEQLFPAKIEDYFQDVQYSYTAYRIDSWDFEIYLEFTIENTEQFQAYVQTIAQAEEFRVFEYDAGWLECVYSEHYKLDSLNQSMSCKDCKEGISNHYIDSAQIAKILIHREEQRVICVALGVHDGGGASCTYFTRYFDRFGIDAKEYEVSHRDSWKAASK